jgi:hypothetical protein
MSIASSGLQNPTSFLRSIVAPPMHYWSAHDG